MEIERNRMNNIITRRSTRTYTGDKLTTQQKGIILEYIGKDENLIGVNGNKIRIEFIEMGGNVHGKIGTYGFIKNAPAFLVVICENNQDNMLDCGYVFEKMVLYLEGLGLGTCWMAGTFNRKQLKIENLSKNEHISIVSPVGVASKKNSLQENLIRKGAKSDMRMDFDELFFLGDFNTKIVDKDVRYILELVRLAPSASNKQPWRVMMDDRQAMHFYIERTPNYGRNKLGIDVQWLDIGICLSHYEIASGKIKFFNEKPDVNMISKYSEYVISVK